MQSCRAGSVLCTDLSILAMTLSEVQMQKQAAGPGAYSPEVGCDATSFQTGSNPFKSSFESSIGLAMLVSRN